MKKILSILFCLAAASCSVETEVGLKGDGVVTLKLNTPTDFGTRALTVKQESAIENVYVLVFDADNKLVDVVEGYNPGGRPDDPSPYPGGAGNGTFQITLPESTADGNMRESKLVVLANAQGSLPTAKTYVGSDYATVVKNLQLGISSAFDRLIPMWGETDPFVVSKANNVQNVELVRALARIDVGVGAPTYNETEEPAWKWDGENADGTIDFKLTSVFVARPMADYMLIPVKAKFDDDLPSLYYMGGWLGAWKEKFSYSVTNSRSLTQTVYTPESDILLSGQPGMSESQKHKTRTAVIVGGQFDANGDKEYDESTSYYRLDFTKNGALTDIVRNHLYQFNIDKVWGRGYDNPTDAYNSDPQNMSFSVLDWDEGDLGDSEFGKQYQINVAPEKLAFETEGGQQTLTVATDYPDDWTVISSEEWLTVEKMSTSSAKVTAGEHIDFTVDRTAKVLITAGPLTISVPVTQAKPDPPTYNVNVFNVPGGTAKATPTQAIESQQVALSVTPSAGMIFAGWTIAPSVTFVSGNDANMPNAKFVMPASDVNVTPVYLKDEVTVGNVIWKGLNVATLGTLQQTIAYDAPAYQYAWTAAANVGGTGTDGSICPDGWRLPTAQEWLDLFDKSTALNFASATYTGTWAVSYDPTYTTNPGSTTLGGVDGTKVETMNGTLFFAASGETNGKYKLTDGFFLSSERMDPDEVYGMHFKMNSDVNPARIYFDSSKMSVRCVKNK